MKDFDIVARVLLTSSDIQDMHEMCMEQMPCFIND